MKQEGRTSTLHPSFATSSQTSRAVFTSPELTAVHVGTIVESLSATRELDPACHSARTAFTKFIMGQYETSISASANQQVMRLEPIGTHFAASVRISSFSLISIASKFSTRSDICSVLLGAAESLNTNGLPEM